MEQLPPTEAADPDTGPARVDAGAGDWLGRLLGPAVPASVDHPLPTVVVGRLVALADDATPLVIHAASRGGEAVRATSIVDLHRAHLGVGVVLAFDGGDPGRPIVLGVLRQGVAEAPPDAASSGHVELLADGQRMVVSANEQLVLRCGLASITLTAAGKVLIRGSHVVSRSSGTHRIQGASIQLN